MGSIVSFRKAKDFEVMYGGLLKEGFVESKNGELIAEIIVGWCDDYPYSSELKVFMRKSTLDKLKSGEYRCVTQNNCQKLLKVYDGDKEIDYLYSNESPIY